MLERNSIRERQIGRRRATTALFLCKYAPLAEGYPAVMNVRKAASFLCLAEANAVSIRFVLTGSPLMVVRAGLGLCARRWIGVVDASTRRTYRFDAADDRSFSLQVQVLLLQRVSKEASAMTLTSTVGGGGGSGFGVPDPRKDETVWVEGGEGRGGRG
jgi:hypothetical protein